jgi:hypothetical protein
VSIRSRQIEPSPWKRGYTPHPSKGCFTEDEKLAKRIALAGKRSERFFVHFDELYVRSGPRSDGPFVAWTAGEWWKVTTS